MVANNSIVQNVTVTGRRAKNTPSFKAPPGNIKTIGGSREEVPPLPCSFCERDSFCEQCSFDTWHGSC